jgi:hypothetical protein
MRTTTRSLARGAGLVALAATLAGCDSMPDSLGPTERDLLSKFTIWNNAPAPMTQVLVHPTANFGGCNQQNDPSLAGGLANFTTNKGQGRDFNLDAGCWVFFVRYEGHPGHVQLAASLGDDDSKSATIIALPVAPAAGVNDGSLRITNAATQHTASISRIYTDACVANNRFYGIGATGGATTDNKVTVAHGASVTIPLPRTCHLVTILWSNGWYQFGTYTINGANTLQAGS